MYSPETLRHVRSIKLTPDQLEEMLADARAQGAPSLALDRLRTYLERLAYHRTLTLADVLLDALRAAADRCEATEDRAGRDRGAAPGDRPKAQARRDRPA